MRETDPNRLVEHSKGQISAVKLVYRVSETSDDVSVSSERIQGRQV